MESGRADRLDGLASRLALLGTAQTLAELVRAIRDVTEAALGGARARVVLRTDASDSLESVILARAGWEDGVGIRDRGLDRPVASTVAVVRAPAEREASLLISAVLADPESRADAGSLLEIVAVHAAVCAERILLVERLGESMQEASALNRAATLLVDALDLESLVENILDAVDEEFGHPICSIFLVRGASLELVGFRGPEMPARYRRLAIEGPGLAARAVRLGHIVNVPDVALDCDYVGAISGTRSELAVPLRVDSELIGVINLESPSDRAFRRPDERVLSSFADQAARAIRSAQLNEQVRQRARREAIVNRIVTAVNRTQDLDEIFSIFCQGLSEATGAERTYIATIDWPERVARFVHSYSADGRPGFSGTFPLSALPELSEKLWRDEVVAVADVSVDALVDAARANYERFGTRSVMYVPVVRSGDWAAVLTLCCDSVREWSEDDIALARTIGEQVGTMILQAELFKEVNEAKRHWETTFDTMSDGVLLVGDDSRVYRANAAASTLLRVTRPDLLELTCCEALATVAGEACPVHEALRERVCVLVRPTPKRVGRPTLVTVDPVVGGGGAVVVLRDLSELRRVEDEVRRQHVIVEQLARSSLDLIAMLDPSGRPLWLNPPFGRALGAGDDPPAARSIHNGIAPAYREMFDVELKRAFGGEPRFFETVIVSEEGRETQAMVSLTAVLDGQTVVGVLFVGRDTTVQRRASERAAEADKLRALGQLSSGVAHNFNNALAVILGRTQLLKRRLGDSPMVRDLEVIERVSHEASHTVRRIQNFARKRRRESFAAVDLAALMADTLDITSIRWRADSQARGVKYDVSLDVGEGEHIVQGEAAELREVFLNVIFNALDAMPDGGSLRATLRNRGGFVEAQIADTGHGMSEEARRRVFEPFFTTKESSGTGLGMAVSYGIISRHDGRIEFETEPGRGTTFSILLPANQMREAVASLDVSPALLPEQRPRATILVVDDNDTVREVVVEALADRGHEVREASGGHRAIELLTVAPADIVVTDFAMPELDGAVLVERIRASWPSTRIVLVTGADIDAIDLGQFAASPDLTLSKPFTLDELCAAVETLIDSTGDAK